ncbi:fatty acid hydroxylase [Pseudoscourfieldia marina]
MEVHVVARSRNTLKPVLPSRSFRRRGGGSSSSSLGKTQQPRAKREPTRASRLTSVEMDATPSPPTTSSRDDVTSNSSRSQSKSAEGVPETLREAVTTFAQHATPQCIALGLTAQLAARIALTPDVIPQLSQQDVVVAACVASFWLFQEWFVHRWLLHSPFEWFGKDIHVGHHNNPYYHVSIDGPGLIVPAMLTSFVVFRLILFPNNWSLALTGCSVYYVMGLLYEWTHYLVHTKYVPKSSFARAIRRHHMLHHCRNENYYLGFTLPAVDSLFGTAPNPRSIPMTDLARSAPIRSAGTTTSRGPLSR